MSILITIIIMTCENNPITITFIYSVIICFYKMSITLQFELFLSITIIIAIISVLSSITLQLWNI